MKRNEEADEGSSWGHAKCRCKNRERERERDVNLQKQS